LFLFFFSSRRRHTRCLSDWSSDVCSSDLRDLRPALPAREVHGKGLGHRVPPIAALGPVKRGSKIPSTSAVSRKPRRCASEAALRSEERRVGKEWRSRWWASAEKVEGDEHQ